MSDSNYWNDKYWPRVMARRLSRRRLIQIGGMGAAGAMAAAYLGCGGGEEATGDATPSLAEAGTTAPPATVFWRRWFGPAAAPGKVQWDGNLETLGACAPEKVTTSLAAGESWIEASGWASDVSMAYFGCRNPSPPYHLIRFDPATNTYTAYTSTDTARYAMGLVVAGGSVYVARRHTVTAACFVDVFSTRSSPPALVNTYQWGSAGTASIATDDTYLFIGTSLGSILLVRLSDMTLVDTLSLPGFLAIHALVYDAASGYLFANSLATGAYKIHRSGDTLVQDAAFNTGRIVCDDIAVAGGYLWLPYESASPGGLVGRIPTTTFDSCENITCGPAGNLLEGVILDSDGLHLWLLWTVDSTEGPGGLTRLRLSDLNCERIWLDSADGKPDDIIQYAPGKYLVSDWADPSKIINLSNPFPSTGIKPPESGESCSYWASLRPYVETTPEVEVASPLAYTDGANGLGTGWTAKGNRATSYTEPTGTEGVSGDPLTTGAYPSLEATPEDIFGWTSGRPKALEGSVANPNVGDVGVAGTDECFLVLQLIAAPTVAPGLSNQETLTITYSDGSAPMSKTASIRGQAGIPAVAG